MTEYLDRSTILNVRDLPTEDVEVPEWGGKVRVRGMNGTERDRFEMAMFLAKDDLAGKAVVRGRQVAWCTVDEAGRRLFSDADVDVLAAKSATALDRIYSVIQRLSGVDEKAAERAARDFGSGQSGSSTSDSPAISGAPSPSSSPDAIPQNSPNGLLTSASPGI